VRSRLAARYKRLHERLRIARRSTALTQAQVAKKLGKPQSFVSKCESGQRRLDVIELDELAQLYGRPLDFFIASGRRSVATGRRRRSKPPTARRRR